MSRPNETINPLKWILQRWWLKWPLFLFIGMVTLLFLVVSVINFMGARKWQATEKELVDAGYVLDWKELVPPDVPDEDNFANTPLFKDLMTWTYTPEGAVDGGTVSVEMNKIHERLSDRMGHLEMGNVNTTSSIAAFNEKIRERADDLFEGIEDVDDILKKNEETLLEIESALRLPSSKFPVRYEDHFAALLPHLQVMRQVSQGFFLSMLNHLEKGEKQEAFADVKSLIRLPQTIEGEPILISQLVYSAMLNSALDGVQEGLYREAWTGDQMRLLIDELAGINLVRQTDFAMRGEMLFLITMMDALIHGDPGLEGELGNVSLFPSGLIQMNKAIGCQLHMENALTQQQIESRVVAESDRYLDEPIENLPKHAFLAKALFPALLRAETRMLERQAQVHAACVALEVEIFRVKSGRLPKNLGELSLPAGTIYRVDSMTGKDLRYQVEGDDSYRIWSLGADRKDQGGKIVRRKNGSVDPEEGDWVWLGKPDED